MKSFKKLKDDFVSIETRTFKWYIGTVIASSLSGFLAGLIIAAIVIFAFFDVSLKDLNIE